MTDLDDLRRVATQAKDASPAWHKFKNFIDTFITPTDAAFIVAASPAVVLELLDAIERSKKTFIPAHLELNTARVRSLVNDLANVRAELDSERRALVSSIVKRSEQFDAFGRVARIACNAAITADDRALIQSLCRHVIHEDEPRGDGKYYCEDCGAHVPEALPDEVDRVS